MTVDSAIFPSFLTWSVGILYVISLVGALRMAPWSRLRSNEQLHVYLGTTVALLLLWHVQADLLPGLSYHLLGLTAVTLMFGWSLAVIAASLALAGVCINTGSGWDGFLVSAMVAGVAPVTLTQIMLILIRWYLPKQFFVYVLVNGFLTGGIVGAACGYLVTWILVSSGVYSFVELNETILPYFPLMFLPEAFLNGWVMVVLVVYRPQWVYSFSDEQYLKGK
jgi:uncharacterized membrane protein